MKARGGKAVYGAPMGILMLQAQFPRILGDMGNARTWPFPVRYKVVPGATPERVVRRSAEGLLEEFKRAGRELVSEGVRAIATNCGFLSIFQDELARDLSVPVATSALMQASAIQALLPPEQKVSVLTISAETLSRRHLEAAGVPPGTPVVGLVRGCTLQRVILDDEPELDVDAARADMEEAARRLISQHPETGAILLECTNMPPYAEAVRAVTGRPVFSIVNLVNWLVGSLAQD